MEPSPIRRPAYRGQPSGDGTARRCAWVLGLGLGLGLAAQLTVAAEPPAPVAAAAPAEPVFTEQQSRVAYAELQAVGAMQYTFYVAGSTEEEKARDVRKRLPNGTSEAYVQNAGFKKMTMSVAQMPAAMRLAIVNTATGYVSEPFKLGDKWAVAVPFGGTSMALPAYEQIKDKLPLYVRSGVIPHPDDALRDPLNAQFAAAQVFDVAALKRLPPTFDVDVVLPNGGTMLVNALLLGRRDLVDGLLARRASPDKCAAGSCPLGAAQLGEDPVGLSRLLLEHGAAVDRVDAGAGVVMTPLATAMLRPRALELAELLGGYRADVNGQPGSVPPVVIAAETGNRPGVEWLLKHGANLYASSTGPAPTNALTAATHSTTAEPAFKTWLAETWTRGARGSDRFAWKGWIEQDGQRVAIDGKAISLRRAPFDVVVDMGDEATLLVAASAEQAITDEFAHGEGKSTLYSIGGIAAEACDGSSSFLNVNREVGSPALWSLHGWFDDGKCHFFTSKEYAGATRLYKRHIASFKLGSAGKTTDVSIGDSHVEKLYVVMGTRLDLVRPWLTYIGPRTFEIRWH